MTTVRAASSATLSGASVPRRAAVAPQEVVHREVLPQGEVLQEVLLRETLAVVVVVPVVMMTTITTHLAAVVEAVVDDVLWDTLRVEIYQKS
jgi:hypothetical protein